MAKPHSKERREEFRDILLKFTPNVYFQVPESVKMKYPAIKYESNGWRDQYASNSRYMMKDEYLVTIIDRVPDSKIVELMQSLPYCRFDRVYKSNNLYHTVFVVKY